MAREISLNIMFLGAKTKGAQRAPGGCTWVCMGAVGYACTGEQENKGKEDNNRCDSGLFCMRDKDNKKRVIDRDG